MYTVSKSAFIKLFILMTVLVAAGYLLVYQAALNKVDEKIKNQPNKGGSVSISITDLQKDFVSLQQGTGSPQTGNINITGDVSAGNIQGSSLTSDAQDGTSPLNVYSSTLVNNLNADMVDGKHAEDLAKTTDNTVATNTTINNITNNTGTDISAWTGSTNIANLGTVIAGIWNAGSITSAGQIQGTSFKIGSTILGATEFANLQGTDQTLNTTSNPSFTGLTLQGSSGVLKSTAGVISGSATTSDLSEGTNQYYTDARARLAISSAGNPVSYNSSTGAVGLNYNNTNLQITANNLNTIQDIAASSIPTFGGMTLNGALSATNVTASGTLNITGMGESSIGGNVTIAANDGSQLVTNGGFTGNANSWTLGSGYTYGSNSVTHGSNGTDPMYQDVSDTTGETYGAELVTNGSFLLDPSTNGWGGSAGWMDSGWHWNTTDAIVHSSGGVYIGSDLGASNVTAGALYKVQVTTSGMVPGTSLGVLFGNDKHGVVYSNGIHTFYMEANSSTWNSWISLEASGENAQMTLDNVSVKRVTGASYSGDTNLSYKVSFNVSGMTAGSFAANLGGRSGASVTGNGTYTQYLTAKPNANIVSYVPSNDARFTISNVSVTQVQNGTITVQDVITTGGSKTDVRAFGAKGDGVTDDTAAIQAAEDSLPDSGGVLFFPAGTFIGHVTLKSNIHMQGTGINASILKLPNGVNTDVVASKDFASLTGTDGNNGTMNVTIDNLTIDGNNASNTSGYGIRKFGAQWKVNDIVIKNCAQDGVWSEWWGNHAQIGGESMEDNWQNSTVTANLGNGINWKGPHDSMWDNMIVFGNGHDGIINSGFGVGLYIEHSHIWGNSQSTLPAGNGILVQAATHLSNVVVEVANPPLSTVGINVSTGGFITANDVEVYNTGTGIYLGLAAAGSSSIVGGAIHGNTTGITLDGWTNQIVGTTISYNTTGLVIGTGFNNLKDLYFVSNTTGLQVGTGGTPVSYNDISAKFASNITHINWANSANASNVLTGSIWTVSGETAFSGTPSSSNKIDILSGGGGTNSILNQLLVNSTKTSGNIISVGAPSATTLTGDITGQLIDMRTNYTDTGYSSTGQEIKTPSVTNTDAGEHFISGSWIDGFGTSIIQNTAAGSNYWVGMGIGMPNITQTTGMVQSTGIAIWGGTVTSGTSYALTTDANAGNVGIGDTTPDTKLKVVGAICAKSDGNNCAGSTAGTIYASAFIDDGVQLTVPDYVFEQGYNLMSVADLKNYIQTNKHLPNIQGMADIKANGLNYGQMIMGLLEKTEENTLYVIDNSEKTDINTQNVADILFKTDKNTQDISQIQNTLSALSKDTVIIPENLKVKTAEVDTLIVLGDATFKGTLTLENGVKIDTKGPKPVCNVEKRGTLWVSQGGSGVEDSTEICIKGVDDVYLWKKLY